MRRICGGAGGLARREGVGCSTDSTDCTAVGGARPFPFLAGWGRCALRAALLRRPAIQAQRREAARCAVRSAAGAAHNGVVHGTGRHKQHPDDRRQTQQGPIFRFSPAFPPFIPVGWVQTPRSPFAARPAAGAADHGLICLHRNCMQLCYCGSTEAVAPNLSHFFPRKNQPCATVTVTGHGLAPHRMPGAPIPMPCQRLFACPHTRAVR